MDYSFYKYINGLTGNSSIDGLLKILAQDLPDLAAPTRRLVEGIALRA